MASTTRMVIRNGRFQLIGVLSLVLFAGALALTYVVISSPGRSFDDPGGFTSGSRALAAVGCILVVIALGTFAASSLRVALILDETGLVIRNPWRTTTVGWDTAPKFEIRGRQQDVATMTYAGSTPRVQGHTTYRYREIVCVARRQRTWIAATSRMMHRDRVDQMLTELREASSRLRQKSAESSRP